MKEFSELVEQIRQNPPTKGFGHKHYRQGLDKNYSGPKYGKSTIADAYYWAGVKNRKDG